MKIINHDLPSELKRLKLLILADVHIGDGLFNEKRIKQFTDEVKNEDNCYIIVNGDLMNNATKESKSDIYAEQYTPKEARKKLVELLTPVKEKILVMLDGNHEDRTYKSTGQSLLETVAEILGIEELYADPAFLLFVAFGKNRGRTERNTVYTIYGKHGSGGGKRIGGKANKLEDMEGIIDADIYIHSHTHQPLSFRKGFYTVDYRNRKTTWREHLFVNSNAFLNYGGYGEKLGYKPSSTVYPHIYLEGKERIARCLI